MAPASARQNTITNKARATHSQGIEYQSSLSLCLMGEHSSMTELRCRCTRLLGFRMADGSVVSRKAKRIVRIRDGEIVCEDCGALTSIEAPSKILAEVS